MSTDALQLTGPPATPQLTGPPAALQLTGPPATPQLTGPPAAPQLTGPPAEADAKAILTAVAKTPTPGGASVDDLLAAALGKVASIEATTSEPRPTASGSGSGTSAALQSYRARDAAGGYVATYEWQALPDGAVVPPGLDIDLPLDGGPRRARIPPRWQLKLWLNDEVGYWRIDVTRDTEVATLCRSAAEHAKRAAVRLLLGGVVVDERLTVEAAGLFGRTRELTVDLCPPPAAPQRAPASVRSRDRDAPFTPDMAMPGSRAAKPGRWETIN
jgi:hypothetical protein